MQTGAQGADVRAFLGWAADRGLAPRLLVPPRPGRRAGSVLDEQSRWEQLDRCIHDTTLPPDVRAAGALVLLYGLPVVRILALTQDALQDRDGVTSLTVGPHPLLIPPRLALLLRALPAAPPRRLFVTSDQGPAWLFPGQIPGRAASNSAFTSRLNRSGLAIRPARGAALIALLDDIPAPVLATLLDLHPGTAARWAHAAQRDWTGYLAARAENQRFRRGARPTRDR